MFGINTLSNVMRPHGKFPILVYTKTCKFQLCVKTTKLSNRYQMKIEAHSNNPPIILLVNSKTTDKLKRPNVSCEDSNAQKATIYVGNNHWWNFGLRNQKLVSTVWIKALIFHPKMISQLKDGCQRWKGCRERKVKM